jgi:hypothetical protein
MKNIYIISLIIIILGIVLFFYLKKPSLNDYSSKSDYCIDAYKKAEKCPEDHCEFGCVGGGPNDVGGCAGGCIPKATVINN